MKTIQLKSTLMEEQLSLTEDGMEGARRATGVPSSVRDIAKPKILPPDPEVPEKKPRRRFTIAYKLRILKEYDACTASGEVGALLRCEGLIILEYQYMAQTAG